MKKLILSLSVLASFAASAVGPAPGLLKEVRARYPGLPVAVAFAEGPSGTLAVARSADGGWRVRAGSPDGFARGLGFVLAGRETQEKTTFRTLGVMIDCSRGRVLKIDYLKTQILRLALMGVNFAMLYTEDTFELPDEPRFGYMRGGYTLAEIKELDAFASACGVELSACIETLGHMNQVLRWKAYADVKDTGAVLLVDEPKTYALIEKEIAFWKEALGSTKRIHVGMDEAWGLGSGGYRTRHGTVRTFDIFTSHITKVAALCTKYGLQPIIWSDEYFRMGSKTRDYYDSTSVIPDDVRAKIPANLKLCYWDYYHFDADHYAKMIRNHRQLGGEPIMASGVWTWFHFWYDHEKTRKTVVPCVEGCRKAGCAEIVFTMWGDNGGYCLPDAELAGMAFAAGVAWGEPPDAAEPDRSTLKAIAGLDYGASLACAEMTKHYWDGWPDMVLEENTLYDDPLFCMAYNNYLARTNGVAALADHRRILEGIRNRKDAPPALVALADVLARKLDYQRDVLAAYGTRDFVTLRMIAKKRLPDLIRALDKFDRLFREDWYRTSQPFGLEVIQRRDAGQRARLAEAAARLTEYLDGKIPRIEELDAALRARGNYDAATFDQVCSGSIAL